MRQCEIGFRSAGGRANIVSYNSDHHDRDDMVEAFVAEYDPEAFDLEAVDGAFALIRDDYPGSR